mmetsp:Transcript_35436/g.72935  ORF Transcript_35436/g.72935 Transcript_35436/m.72935 type:complete len:270 (+) Transcript_35436:1630-2439(+)
MSVLQVFGTRTVTSLCYTSHGRNTCLQNCCCDATACRTCSSASRSSTKVIGMEWLNLLRLSHCALRNWGGRERKRRQSLCLALCWVASTNEGLGVGRILAGRWHLQIRQGTWDSASCSRTASAGTLVAPSIGWGLGCGASGEGRADLTGCPPGHLAHADGDAFDAAAQQCTPCAPGWECRALSVPRARRAGLASSSRTRARGCSRRAQPTPAWRAAATRSWLTVCSAPPLPRCAGLLDGRALRPVPVTRGNPQVGVARQKCQPCPRSAA